MKALVVGDIIQDILVMPVGPVQINDDNWSKLEERTGGSQQTLQCGWPPFRSRPI